MDQKETEKSLSAVERYRITLTGTEIIRTAKELFMNIPLLNKDKTVLKMIVALMCEESRTDFQDEENLKKMHAELVTHLQEFRDENRQLGIGLIGAEYLSLLDEIEDYEALKSSVKIDEETANLGHAIDAAAGCILMEDREGTSTVESIQLRFRKDVREKVLATIKQELEGENADISVKPGEKICGLPQEEILLLLQMGNEEIEAFASSVKSEKMKETSRVILEIRKKIREGLTMVPKDEKERLKTARLVLAEEEKEQSEAEIQECKIIKANPKAMSNPVALVAIDRLFELAKLTKLEQTALRTKYGIPLEDATKLEFMDTGTRPSEDNVVSIRRK